MNTVAKVMAELGLAGRKVRRRRSLTRLGRRPSAPDFVRRDFTAEEPDLVWVVDLTEIETGEGKSEVPGTAPARSFAKLDALADTVLDTAIPPGDAVAPTPSGATASISTTAPPTCGISRWPLWPGSP